MKIAAIYAGLLIFALAPLFSAFAAGAIASAAGAKLDEGSAHPCIIWGHDFGELLYSMFVVFWFSLVTIPVGLLAIIVFTLYLLLRKKEPISEDSAAPERAAGPRLNPSTGSWLQARIE